MQRLTAFILSGVPALLSQQLGADLETVCPSVCQLSYFQNLISARLSHPHRLEHISISQCTEIRLASRHHVQFDLISITIILQVVGHKHLTNKLTHVTLRDS